MRKVLFGTPCYDGKVHVEFLQSLLHTVALAKENDIAIFPVQVCHDALIQRARNDFVRMALETNCDDLIFMDSDQEWNSEWVLRLLNHDVDVVGCPVPKKQEAIDFNIKLLPEGLPKPVNGLLKVQSVGTGFMRISRRALESVWQISEEYNHCGMVNRMVFDVRIMDGELISEDNIFCRKWQSLGRDVWVDPSMTCSHIGQKKYTVSFTDFIAGRH